MKAKFGQASLTWPGVLSWPRHWLAMFRTSGYPFMLTLACAVGILGGLAAIGFRLLVEQIQWLLYGQARPTLDYLATLPTIIKFLAPVAGAAMVGPLIYFCAHEAQGHGVPEVMSAVAINHGIIRGRVVFIKYLAAALSIGSGNSVGRTGPIVQVGASLGSFLGICTKLNPARLKILVGCGAAAGIAATFNAPMAGVLFALEVILGDFGTARFSPIVVSSVTATVISRSILGNHVAFGVIHYHLASLWEIPLYIAMGLVMAVWAVFFVKMLCWLEDFFARLSCPAYIKPILGSLVVGLVACIGLPHIMGVGYQTIELALAGRLSVGLLVTLAVIKILATSMTIGSGGSGGVFAPSLFIGAVLGDAFGELVHGCFPGVTSYAGAYALVGTAAMVAATTHAPLTAILLLFEMTNNYAIILPLMLTCIVSTIFAARLYSPSIYTIKLLRRGIDIQHGEDLNLLKDIRAAQVMQQDCHCFHEELRVAELLSQALSLGLHNLIVVDDNQKVRGIIYTNELLRYSQTHPDDNTTCAGDLMQTDFPQIHPDTTLDIVSQYFANHAYEVIPVISKTGELLGSLLLHDVLRAYNQEIFKRNMPGTMKTKILNLDRQETKLDGEHALIEIDLPLNFVGQRIKDVQLRQRYQVNIIFVRRQGTIQVPDADLIFQTGDRILLTGKTENIQAVKKAWLQK